MQKIVINNVIYYQCKGVLHRRTGPAVVRPDGIEEWWMNGDPHRDGGPAIIYPNGYKAWFSYGELHRIDGPAVIHKDGMIEWWISGKRYYSREAWFNALSENAKKIALFSEAFICH